MKKVGLICAVVLASCSLVACGTQSSTKKATSSRSSSRVVKHHKKQNKKKQSSSSSASSIMNESAQQNSNQQSIASQQPDTWRSQQQPSNQSTQNGSPTSEDQARAMLGGANGDLQATRTANGWTFSGEGYTATVGDDGTISHN